MLLAISFFAFDYFFNSSNIKGMKFVHQNYAMKNRGHHAQELKSIVTLCLVHLLKNNTVFSVHLLKNNTVFMEFKRACSPDFVIFMRSTGCQVKY